MRAVSKILATLDRELARERRARERLLQLTANKISAHCQAGASSLRTASREHALSELAQALVEARANYGDESAVLECCAELGITGAELAAHMRRTSSLVDDEKPIFRASSRSL